MIKNSKYFINGQTKIYTINKRNFLLKYMLKKGWIPNEAYKKTDVKSTEGVNLKELLDEKNIKIDFKDILTDYRYFRKEYFFKDLNAPQVKPTLPFEKKDVSFKTVFHYYFIKVNY